MLLEIGMTDQEMTSAPNGQVVMAATVEPQETPAASTPAGTANASGNEGSSRSLVPVGGDRHAWGGPRIRWADRRDPKATIFALDDEAEVKEWRNLHLWVGAVTEALATVLGMMGDVVTPVGQVPPIRAPNLYFSSTCS